LSLAFSLLSSALAAQLIALSGEVLPVENGKVFILSKNIKQELSLENLPKEDREKVLAAAGKKKKIDLKLPLEAFVSGTKK
jgi:hypothetical protein